MKNAHHRSFAEDLARFTLPRYDDIPSIELYMDQLIGYVEDVLRPIYGPNEKIMTRSMVNNYVKQGIIAPPLGKKYGRDAITHLIVIGVYKRIFSIKEIAFLFQKQADSFDTPIAYNYFCNALETACRIPFLDADEAGASGLMLTSGNATGDFERDLVIASCTAVAYALYIKASVEAAAC